MLIFFKTNNAQFVHLKNIFRKRAIHNIINQLGMYGGDIY